MRRFVPAVVFLAMAVACSAPPDKERHQAEGAIDAARAADAATYAPDELKSATDALSQYDAAVSDRDYRQALRLALEARDSAYEAVKRAGDEKAAARSEAEHLIAETDDLLQLADTRLSAGGRLTPAAAERLRTESATAAKRLQEARAALLAQKYRDVTTILTPVVDDLHGDLGPAPAAAAKKPH